MNTPYKESATQKTWMRRNKDKWREGHDKPLCYNVCVACGDRYISVDCYKRKSEAEKSKAKLEELNPNEKYVIIGNYRG